MRRSLLIASVIAALLVLLTPATPVRSQEEPATLSLSAPYLGISVEPGEASTLEFKVDGPIGEQVTLATEEYPEGWTVTILGGGFVVDRVMVTDEAQDLELRVEVPANAPTGTSEITVGASSDSGSDKLTFVLTVAEAVGGDVVLATEFPVLSGPSDVTFTYNLDLENNTSEEIQFGLEVRGPEGWQLSASPSGQTRASTVTLAAGESERITVEADPPDTEPAGAYPLIVTASGGGESAQIQLGVEISGNFDLTLTTPDERLNVDVVAGEPTEMALLVINDGTAPLTDVSITSTAPRGWEVDMSPGTVPLIEPGGVAEVVASITPSEDAIAGDYRITFRSSIPEASDEFEVRATVETAAFWGLVGAAVIVAALGGLALVFRRFGRR